MSCTTRLSKTLRARGFRMTPQRLVILQVLHDGGHLTPLQVYQRACQALPGMTETTVYRTLDFLVDNGVVVSASTGNPHLAYELADQDHHHLTCRICHQTIVLDHDPIQDFYARLESTTGYRLTGGHFNFVGLCADCKAK